MKKLLILIDKILNPKATDLPILYCKKADKYDFSTLKRHWVIKEYDEGDKHYLWVIRWL